MYKVSASIVTNVTELFPPELLEAFSHAIEVFLFLCEAYTITSPSPPTSALIPSGRSSAKGRKGKPPEEKERKAVVASKNKSRYADQQLKNALWNFPLG